MTLCQLSARSNNKDKITKAGDFSWGATEKLGDGKIIYREGKGNKEEIWSKKDKTLRIWSRRSTRILKMRQRYTILDIQKRVWKWTWLMNSWNRVITCSRDDSRILNKAPKTKSIRERGENPNWYFKVWPAFKKFNMSYKFTTVPSSPNSYVPCTVNNLDFIMTLNKKKKDWIKKYFKIIQRLKTIADIQLQIQDIIKQANVVNNQLVDIETIPLYIEI